jgi:hypothetical protein
MRRGFIGRGISMLINAFVAKLESYSHIIHTISTFPSQARAKLLHE